MPLDLFTRRAAFRPTTLDRDNRTVRVTVSTGAAVQRPGYIERLTLPDPQTIVGLPVLNAHRQDGLDNLLGRVVAAGADEAGLWADVQISERADWLLGEIEAGIVTSASIGYRQGKAARSTDPATGQPVRTIIPDISEISFVPVPRRLPPDPATRVPSAGAGIPDPPKRKRGPMTHNIYGITEAELFRLVTAYSAIKNPTTRTEFLRTVEAWAVEQWDTSGSEGS